MVAADPSLSLSSPDLPHQSACVDTSAAATAAMAERRTTRPLSPVDRSCLPHSASKGRGLRKASPPVGKRRAAHPCPRSSLSHSALAGRSGWRLWTLGGQWSSSAFVDLERARRRLPSIFLRPTSQDRRRYHPPSYPACLTDSALFFSAPFRPIFLVVVARHRHRVVVAVAAATVRRRRSSPLELAMDFPSPSQEHPHDGLFDQFDFRAPPSGSGGVSGPRPTSSSSYILSASTRNDNMAGLAPSSAGGQERALALAQLVSPDGRRRTTISHVGRSRGADGDVFWGESDSVRPSRSSY